MTVPELVRLNTELHADTNENENRFLTARDPSIEVSSIFGLIDTLRRGISHDKG